jgi:hypothetical protein
LLSSLRLKAQQEFVRELRTVWLRKAQRLLENGACAHGRPFPFSILEPTEKLFTD